MKILKNQLLADYTAFKVGGVAKKLVFLDSAYEILDLKNELVSKHWTLGYATNCLISDRGLDGTVFMLREGPKPIHAKKDILIIDGATSWDQAVGFACRHDLWGVELMSGIPGNTGAALSGNIAAYGQAISDVFSWAEVFDPNTNQVIQISKGDVEFGYRSSSLQNKRKDQIILKVALALSKQPTTELVYASAFNVAKEMNLTPDSIGNRRKIILEARKRAGSIYYEAGANAEHTAGSFFKNPVVDQATAKHLAGFDESGKNVEELLEQNRIHGGNQFRVSAAHVLLAAGFKRGQAWGPVRLHSKHVLKIENTGNATAQQIYDVAQEIIAATKSKLNIKLKPEVQFLGKF